MPRRLTRVRTVGAKSPSLISEPFNNVAHKAAACGGCSVDWAGRFPENHRACPPAPTPAALLSRTQHPPKRRADGFGWRE